MASGLFGEDCSVSIAWLDPSCLVQAAGSGVGSALTNALEPVWIVLGILAVLLIVILFAPNTKHIIPHLSFL